MEILVVCFSVVSFEMSKDDIHDTVYKSHYIQIIMIHSALVHSIFLNYLDYGKIYSSLKDPSTSM